MDVSRKRWSQYENGLMYTEIANGTFKGHDRGKATHFYQGYIGLIRAYGMLCSNELKRFPSVSVNYDWETRDENGITDTEKVFDESILMRKRFSTSFDTAFRDSRKKDMWKGFNMISNPGQFMLSASQQIKISKKLHHEATQMLEEEGCASYAIEQLFENYHRKLSQNSPYIQEVDERLKKLSLNN